MKKMFPIPLKQILIFAIIVSGIIGCEKDAKEFGEQIMHPDDSIVAKYDTSFKVNTYVERSDSFQTLFSSIKAPNIIQNSNILLGDYVDPYFGRTKASFLSQIYKTDSLSFDSLNAEGATLYFKLGEIYGNFGITEAEINVYKLNEGLDITQQYFFNLDPLEHYDPVDKISESTEFQGDSLIKVTLTEEFANSLTMVHDTVMGDNSDFLSQFPGIFVEMESTSGGEAPSGFINQIKIENDTSKMELAVRKIDEEEIDTLYYPIPSVAMRVNTFNHDFEAATSTENNIYDFMKNDPSENDSILFIKSLGGTRARIEIPEQVRETFSQDTNFLSRAEIELKPLYDDQTLSLFPEAVSMYAYPRDTTYLNISNNQFFNGTYDEDKNVFSCNITSYVQAYINGEVNNNRIYIQIENFRFEPGQLIISGKNHANPIKFRIKYYKP